MPMFQGRLSNIDLRLLHVFKTVVDCGGLSAAQIELGIGLATISKHLTDLESRLSLRLCMRGRSGFALTENGHLVHRATLRLFAAVDDFGVDVNEAHSQLVGQLTIGVVDNTVTDPTSQLVARLRRFSEDAPQARLKLFVISPNEIEVGVIEGRINVGILPVYHRVPGLRYVHFHDEVSKLYCGKSHELFHRLEGDISEAELARQAYVDRGYTESLEKKNLAGLLMPGATALHTEGVALLILSGRYIGFLPEHYAQQWCVADEMRPLQPNKMKYSTPLCAIVRVGPARNRLVDTFLGQSPRKRSFSDAKQTASAKNGAGGKGAASRPSSVSREKVSSA